MAKNVLKLKCVEFQNVELSRGKKSTRKLF